MWVEKVGKLTNCATEEGSSCVNLYDFTSSIEIWKFVTCDQFRDGQLYRFPCTYLQSIFKVVKKLFQNYL
jgi:hypothetical protein